MWIFFEEDAVEEIGAARSPRSKRAPPHTNRQSTPASSLAARACSGVSTVAIGGVCPAAPPSTRLHLSWREVAVPVQSAAATPIATLPQPSTSTTETAEAHLAETTTTTDSTPCVSSVARSSPPRSPISMHSPVLQPMPSTPPPPARIAATAGSCALPLPSTPDSVFDTQRSSQPFGMATQHEPIAALISHVAAVDGCDADCDIDRNCDDETTAAAQQVGTVSNDLDRHKSHPSPPLQLPSPMQVDPPNPPLAVSSGRDRLIDPSADALARTEAKSALFDVDEEVPPPQMQEPPAGFELGFSSGRGTRIAISATALKRAEAKAAAYQDGEDALPVRPHGVADHSSSAMQTDEPPAGFQLGFSSGRGSRIAISAHALQRAQKKFDQMHAEAETSSDTANARAKPPTASVPAASFSAGASSSIPPDFQLGFKTGLHRPVTISDDAMRRAQAKFAHDDDDADGHAAGDEVKVRDDSNAVPALTAEADVIPANFQVGFTSGRSSRITISADALKRAEAKSAAYEEREVDRSPPSAAPAHMAQPPTNFELGFSSGRGARIAISDTAMKRAEAKAAAYQDSDVDQPSAAKQTDEPPAGFQLGFSSGRGSRIAISAQALARAEAKAATFGSEDGDRTTTPQRHAQQDPPPSDEPPIDFQLGFTSGRGSRVAISAAALKQAEAKFALDEQHTDASDMDTTDTNTGHIAPVADATPSIADASDSSVFATPASKKRKSNFSTALPMPMATQEDDADSIAGTPTEMRMQTHAEPVRSHPPVQAPQFHTPAQPPRPAPRPSSATAALRTPALAAPSTLAAPASAPLTRKRAFVSPRVTNKAATALLPPATTPQPNLLTVRSHKQNNVAHTPNTTVDQRQAMVPHQPASLGVGVSLPVASDAKKIDLRRFAAACQAKVAAQLQAQVQPAAVTWVSHTNIPVEYVTSVNAPLVRFLRPEDAHRPGVTAASCTLGVMDARASLLALGLSSSLCSERWVRNHYRWIVWKLASYQRRFSAALAQPPCTYERLVQHLHARYQREINQVKLPALRQILEGDEAAGKFLILMVTQVVGVKTPPSAITGRPPCASWVDDSGAIPTRPGTCEVELSDGWYSVWVKLDLHLHYQLQRGKLYPGQKLRIWGAQLAGPMPTTPLENNETYMKIQINSVRRAYWHSTLGVQRSSAFVVNFASLRPDGGLVPAIQVAVSKQYPTVYLHPPMTDAAAPPLPPIANPSGDGAADTPPPAKVRKLHCNERSHNVRMHLHERFCEQRVEALQSSFLDRQPRGKTTPTRDELDAQAAQWENAKSELEAELQEIHKSVVPYIKLHLCEIRPASRRDDSSDSVGDGAAAVSRWSGECCSLTSWRPTEEHRELFTPGREYVLLGCAMHARFRPTNSLAFPKPNYQPATSLPMVPHPYSAAASSHYLQLATSRMTNIVPYDMSRKRVTQMHSTRPTSNAHLYSPFLRAPIFLRPDELLSMSRGAEFDCVCLVLWANDEGDQTKSSSVGVKPATPSTPSGSGGGSWKRTRRLLCLGLSGDLMVVEVKESEESLHFTQAIQTPQVMSMENLHYGVYEKKLRLHSVSSTVMSRFTSKGGVQLATSDAPLAATTSHAAYAQPDIAHFQAWLAQPTTALLCELAMARSRRIMDGSWHRDAAINTLNKDEFKHLPRFDVSGHVYPLEGALSLACAKSDSLARLCVSVDSSLYTPAAKKKSAASLLSAKAASSDAKKKSQEIDCALTDDCSSASTTSAVCYHTCHTLSHLLDSANWSMLLLLDDAVRRWPLQLNACAFRRLLKAVEPPPPDLSVADDTPASSLAHWCQQLLATGDVPHIDFDPPVPQQDALHAAMAQLRQHTFRRILDRLHMDKAHQREQYADWIMLILSHSSVASPSAYLDAPLSSFLASVSPSWSVADPASSSLVDARILFSPTHADQVRVDLQCTPVASLDEDASDAHMVPTESREGAQTPSGEVLLTPLQVSELDQLLRRPRRVDSDATSGDDECNSRALFYFTTLEWLALCEQVCATIARVPVAFHLAECERPAVGPPSANEPPLATHTFKAVFIPKADDIRRAK